MQLIGQIHAEDPAVFRIGNIEQLFAVVLIDVQTLRGFERDCFALIVKVIEYTDNLLVFIEDKHAFVAGVEQVDEVVIIDDKIFRFEEPANTLIDAVDFAVIGVGVRRSNREHLGVIGIGP